MASYPPGQADNLSRARQQLERSNWWMMEEIGRLAQELGQRSSSPQVRDLADRILQCCNQYRANEQAQQRV